MFRPAWLFEVPFAIGYRHEYLHWRGGLQLISGPERIEGDWWGEAAARDYFVAQRGDGLRALVYRDLGQDEWFVQGVFG